MIDDNGGRHVDRRAVLVIATLIAAGAALAVAVATGVLRAGSSGHSAPSGEKSAQQRCESDVRKRLMSPDTATLTDLQTEKVALDLAARDFSSVTASDQLKGIDPAHITVLNVSGVVNAPSQVGSVLHDRFDCRAYFVDGSLAHTLVVFDHDH